MKPYVVVNGLVYLAILLAHVARVLVEGVGPLSQPIFLASSAVSMIGAAWSVRVYRGLRAAEPRI